jgi:HK97 family phage portal protein
MPPTPPPGYKPTPSGLLIPDTLAMRAQETSSFDAPAGWLTNAMGGARTRAGTDVSPYSAMSIAAYFACIRNISEDIGKLPLLTYKRLPRGKERALKHPLYKLLSLRPNPNHSAMTLKETMTQFVLGWGNAYAEIVFDPYTGYAAELWPIHPSRVRVMNLPGEGVVYDVRSSHNQWMGGQAPFEAVRLPARSVLHVRGLGAEGMYGYSIAQLAAESLGLTIAAENFGAAFFGNGTWLGGVLEHPGVLGEEAIKHLRESWEGRYRGPDNAGKPAILEEGMTWHQLGVPPEDAQFIATREFQIEEIARWFRMPLHKIGHLGKVRSGTVSIEQQSIEYVTDTLMPWMVRFEQEIAIKLFTDDEDSFAEFLVNALMRGDSVARGDFYKTMFEMAALSPNDIRELESQNPIGPDGDHYFLPANNLAPIHLVVTGATNMPNQPGPAEQPAQPEKPAQPPPAQPPGPARRNGQRNGVHHEETVDVDYE